MWTIVITEEMRAAGLAGNDLLVYAVINSYSHGEQGCFYGSRQFLCEATGAAERTIKLCLKRLLDEGHIRQSRIEVEGRKTIAYTVTQKGQNLPTEKGNICPQKGQNLPTDNKIYINTERDIKARTREKSVPFTAPTVAEVAAYCRERRNNIDPEEFVAHYESNGWVVGKAPMKSWKAAVVSWEKHRLNEQQPRQAPRRESAFERAMKVGDKLFGTNNHDRLYGPQSTNPFNPDEQ